MPNSGTAVFRNAFHLAHGNFADGGVCLEFGVFKGATYCYQAQFLLTEYTGSSLIGFDSWQGLPPETEGEWCPPQHAVGRFAAPRDHVVAQLAKLGIQPDDPRFRLVDGFFEDSLTAELQSTIDNVIFINIDVDVHKSTMELLDFVEPFLRPGVVIYWDDWMDPTFKAPRPWGEHLAWAQWHEKHPNIEVDVVERNRVNQQTMVVTKS